MSTTVSFAPWARTGIGGALTAPPGAIRAQLPIDVQVGGYSGGSSGTAAAPVVNAPPLIAQTLGPGDVLGIDPRVIARTDPGPYAQGVPAHSLVSIEFSNAAFPWLFSPLVPDAQQRLQPWLCLIVVPQRVGIAIRSRDNGLPVLTIGSAGDLPDLAEAWAWAHTQTQSDRTVSRLVSARRLERATSYYACLVPAFNVGRQVGLDPTVDPAGPLAPAWTADVGAGFELPVYYSWSFATGEAGDFHDLVARLSAQPLPLEGGWQPLTIGFPSSPPPPGFHPVTAPLQGVLRNMIDPPAVSDPASAAVVAQELRRVVGLPRTVAPPRYGQAQADAAAPWLDDLNANPVARIAAATGARVVQARQEALVAEAWAQAAELQRANQQRRQADAALAVGDALMRRHLQVMPANRLLQVAAQTGLPTSGALPAATVANVAATTLGGTFRRLQRRAGSLARRSAPTTNGSGLASLAFPSVVGPNAMSVLDRTRLAMTKSELFPQQAAVIPFPEGDGMPFGHSSARATYKWTGLVPADTSHGRPRPTTITRFVSIAGATVSWTLDDATQFSADSDPLALQIRQGTAAIFRASARAAQDYLHNTMMARADTMTSFRFIAPDPGDVVAACARMIDALSPARAIVGRVTAGNASAFVRTLRQTAAAAPGPEPGAASLATRRFDPSFTQGMYSALAELAPDLFLVGADRMPDNAVSLVQTNAAFIEAYLAGLNHELGRELLWRGFPTDGRGTYFRRFWDSDNYPAMTAWRQPLGANAPTPAMLVLLIRGELVRRFPKATIFAQRGSLVSGGGQFVPAPEPRRTPLFQVTVRNDLLCVGFDLTRTQAFDYFFGIEEPVTDPRFAAPAPGTGTHVALSELALGAGATAADVAAATLRRPVRVLIDPHMVIPS